MCYCSNMGVEPNKSQHMKLTREETLLLLPGFKLTTFRSPVWCSTNKPSWISSFNIFAGDKTCEQCSQYLLPMYTNSGQVTVRCAESERSRYGHKFQKQRKIKAIQLMYTLYWSHYYLDKRKYFNQRKN